MEMEGDATMEGDARDGAYDVLFELPDDVLYNIMSYLPGRTLARLEAVSRAVRRMLTEDAVPWANALTHEGGRFASEAGALPPFPPPAALVSPTAAAALHPRAVYRMLAAFAPDAQPLSSLNWAKSHVEMANGLGAREGTPMTSCGGGDVLLVIGGWSDGTPTIRADVWAADLNPLTPADSAALLASPAGDDHPLNPVYTWTRLTLQQSSGVPVPVRLWCAQFHCCGRVMPPPPKHESKKEKLERLAREKQERLAAGGAPAAAEDAAADGDAAAPAAAPAVAPPATRVRPPAAPAATPAATPASSIACGGGASAVLDEDMTSELSHQQLLEQAMSLVQCTFASARGAAAHANMRDVKVQGLSINLLGRELLLDTELHLAYGQRYGLIGPNGCGKSILLAALGRRVLPLPASMSVYHLACEHPPTDETAFAAVMSCDSERLALEATVATLEEGITGEDTPAQAELSDELNAAYERLESMGAAQAEARAAQILFGLGFSHAMQQQQCKDFSGGWRMRVALARALFLSPSLLLLDEPTNHLDMEAVIWLEQHLAKYKSVLLMVSHSSDFMDNVCTQTIRVHKKTLQHYGGSYSTYVQTRAEKEEAQMKAYSKEQERIADVKDFVARFGHGTRKMAQQAQSREKILSKMTEGGLAEAVEVEHVKKLRFPDPGSLPPPILQVTGVTFAYPGRKPLYEKLDFAVGLDSRIAMLGPNGAGKTTFLKLLAGDLIPSHGAVRPNQHLRIARFTQHAVDSLDLTQTPLAYFSSLSPDSTIAEVRGRLGRYGIGGSEQSQVMATLSDGLKSRVVLALMAHRSPHILLLDEPTNNLDIVSIDALAEGINAFEGGVVLVSHDMRLIQQVAKEVWECNAGRVTRVSTDIMAYKRATAARLERAAEAFERDRRARASSGRGV